MDLQVKTINNISFIDTQEDFNKPVLVILHGWMQNKESWIPIIKILSKKHRIICFDLPAFGESVSDRFLDFNIQDYCAELLKVLEELSIKKAYILGHSFGGKIAGTIASQNKEFVSGLILFSSAGIKSISFMRKIMLALSKVKTALHIKAAILPFLRSNDYKNAGNLSKIFLNTINIDLLPILNDIQSPTLIIWGDNDTELNIRNAYKFEENIKNSKVKIMKGYGHFAHLQAPELFSTLIDEYFTKLENGIN